MKIGKRIRSERLRRGMTQVSLADAVGVRSDSISKFERDCIQPGVETLRRLARVFGTSIDELVGQRSAA